MASQIKPSVTNPTIADIYQSIQSNQLILRPDFQRKFVWTHDHQEEFLDTILNGLPFPEIYVSQGEVDVKNLRTTRNVIDGQQRLTTIRNYIEGNHEKKLIKIPYFKSLSDEKKQEFVTYQIVMRDIGKVDEDTVREIFRRINLTKFKLEDVEIHNAVYDGHFIKTAKLILNNINLKDYGVLKESEFTRMADLHFVLLVMATLENEGYFAQDSLVESNIAKFNEEYENQDKTAGSLIETFTIIDKMNLPVDSMWFRKSNFFTLVVEITMHLKKLPADLRDRLLIFEQQIMKFKGDTGTDFAKYYSYMYQATHGRTARVTRSEILKQYVF